MDPADLADRLRAAGCVYAEDEAALIVEAAAGDADRLESLTAGRVTGRPLEHLLGWAGFDGLRLTVTDGVFVPRQRTLLLVDLAEASAPTAGTVVDLCCGSGALAAALVVRRPDLEVHAADLDPDAVACARLNLAGLGPGRVHEGDLYDALPGHLRGRVDVLVVNAPYVPSDELDLMPGEARDHEHRIALDGGSDGLDLHRRVAAGATSWLAPGGLLVIEVAPMQVDTATDVMAAAGLQPAVAEDDDREATAVIGRARGRRSLV